MKSYLKSPLNYIGGKHKLLPQILPLFPDKIYNFVDLFGGGFNVGINVKADRYVYNDSLKQLSELMEFLYTIPISRVIHEIENIIKEYNLSKTNREGYLALRNDYNTTPDPLSLYVLSAYSFNNQIRFNSKDEFNMPFGMNRSKFTDSMCKRLIEFTERIKILDIQFESLDFRDLEFEKYDFVYCDPPYYNSVATYNENSGWNANKEFYLRTLLIKLNRQGIKWALSNDVAVNTDIDNWAFGNKFTVHRLEHSYNNCNYQKKNKETREVLITNY